MVLGVKSVSKYNNSVMFSDKKITHPTEQNDLTFTSTKVNMLKGILSKLTFAYLVVLQLKGKNL